MTARMKTLHRLVWIAFFLCSCGPAWHLKKAQEKGAAITADTVFQDMITERTVTDTLVKFQHVTSFLQGDTLTVETVRWKTRTLIDKVTQIVYQQVECKPDTVRVPVAVTTQISAGYTKWELIGSVFGALLFVGLIAYGVYRFINLSS